MSKILIVDDEQSICNAFSTILRQEKHSPLFASNGQQAITIAQQDSPELIFLDIQLPDMTGLEVLNKLRDAEIDIPVIIMTAYGTMNTAMEATKLGAFDYIGKPIELSQIRALLKQVLHQKEDNTLPASENNDGIRNELIGNSAVMQNIFKLISGLINTDLPIVISGESGVGKSLAAKAIHYNSERKAQPFIAVDCQAIPEQHLEKELFGYQSPDPASPDHTGQFGAAAEGTLMLSEISCLPIYLQSKLLQVIEEKTYTPMGGTSAKPFTARLITSTNLDLETEVKAGRFHENLFFRLKLATLNIPPLRQHKEDIPPLAQHFLNQANNELKTKIKGIESSALKHLEQYHWPGNIRELKSILSQAVLTAKGAVITQYDLQHCLPQTQTHEDTKTDPITALTLPVADALNFLIQHPEQSSQGFFQTIVTLIEEELIEQALKITNGNQVAASQLLGVHRTTLRKKIKQN